MYFENVCVCRGESFEMSIAAEQISWNSELFAWSLGCWMQQQALMTTDAHKRKHPSNETALLTNDAADCSLGTVAKVLLAATPGSCTKTDHAHACLHMHVCVDDYV